MYRAEEHYLIKELTTIIGLNKDTVLGFDLPYIISTDYPKSNRPVKIVFFKDFEVFLNTNKCWNFDIPEFAEYKTKKRPIMRQFLTVQETSLFFELYGNKLHPRTLIDRINKNKLPAYKFGRKFIIPIVSIIKILGLTIDSEFENVVGKVIKENYKFKL